MAEILYVDWDGLIYYDGKVKDYIDDKVYDCLKFKGDITFSELMEISPSFDNVNIAYRVTDTIYTNDWFKAPGYKHSPNTVVYVASVEENVYKYDILFEPGQSSGGNVDLSDYFTKEETLDLLENTIPFDDDKIVKNPIGGFKMDDSLMGMTIQQILTKLLGLVDADIEDSGIVEDIVSNETPMYSINADGEVVEVPYKLLVYDNSNYDSVPVESGFYQYVMDNDIVESGYQDITSNNDSVYYTIALPKGIDVMSMVTLKVYDSLENVWKIADELHLTNDPEIVSELCAEANIDVSHIDTDKYSIWISDTTPTGSIYRYVINE